MFLLYSNNAQTTLAGPISSTTTTIVLQSGAGALFPNPGNNQYFTITMIPQATGIPGEIMWCTARSTDTLTVIRAQEGTTGTAYLAGDAVWNQNTAGTMAGQMQMPVYAGNPNGNFAGGVGTAEVPPSAIWDNTTNAIWICTTASSNPSNAIWTKANYPYGSNPVGVISGGYLTATSTTVLTFAQSNGTQVPISGTFQTIPGGGVTISNSGLAASTLYYVYVTISAGSMILVLSTTGHTVGAFGYPVSTANAAYTLIGMIYTSGSSQFVPISATQVLCLNYYNRTPYEEYVAVTGTATTVATELNTGDRMYLLAWPNVPIFILMTGEQSSNTVNGGGSVLVYVDGAQWTSVAGGGTAATAVLVPTTAFGNLPMTEGYHYVQTVGLASGTGNTATFDIASTLTVSG
jgi:hypothetical protein